MTTSSSFIIIAGGWDGGGDTSGFIWMILLLSLPYLATADQIIAKHGIPFESFEFSIGDASPRQYLQFAMKNLRINSARVIAYRETSTWGQSQICYLLFDSTSGKFVGATISYPEPLKEARPNNIRCEGRSQREARGC